MRPVNQNYPRNETVSARATIAIGFVCALAITGVIVVRARVNRSPETASTPAKSGSSDEQIIAAPAQREYPSLPTEAERTAVLPAAAAKPDEAADSEYSAPFESEDRNAAWATRAERDIQATFTGFPGSAMVKVECRSSICFVSATHGDAAAYDAWVKSFAAAVRPASKMNSARSDQPDGTVESKSFLLPSRQAR